MTISSLALLSLSLCSLCSLFSLSLSFYPALLNPLPPHTHTHTLTHTHTHPIPHQQPPLSWCGVKGRGGT